MKENNHMQILIAGDLVPTQSNMDLFSNANVDSLLGDELLSLWNSADMRIFNLEVPLTDKKNPIAKCGPNLVAATNTVNGIRVLNPTLVILANNHILDQGASGLKSTEDILSKNDIHFIGAGDNLSGASKPFIFHNDGLRIGIYACTDHEFSIATDNTPGANPFDPLESLDHIRKLRDGCDYVIVVYHGGKEHYRYPSPFLQKVCRKMVQKGADIVICQHSHCIGCSEEYEGSTIIYGQGNFLFDDSDSEFWQTSLLVNLRASGRLEAEYIPIAKHGNGVRLAEGQEAEDIMLAFRQRSNEIAKEGFVENRYAEFAKESMQSYLRNLSGFGRFMSWIDRRLMSGALVKAKYKSNQLMTVQNYIECEAHRELILAGLENMDK
jgi:hypothetical protein